MRPLSTRVDFAAVGGRDIDERIHCPYFLRRIALCLHVANIIAIVLDPFAERTSWFGSLQRHLVPTHSNPYCTDPPASPHD